MKKKLIYLVLCTSVIFFIGCSKYAKPYMHDIDRNIIPSFNGNGPVAVIVPEAAMEKYQVQYADPNKKRGPNTFVDLNDMYWIAKELIQTELANHQIKSEPSAEKTLKFNIDSVTWETWAGGFSMGSYLEFNVETGDGYKKHYKVQDGSGWDVGSAIGGTISRAVEKIFQDDQVIQYLKK